MARRVPMAAQMSPWRQRPVGVTVLDLNRQVFTPFSTAGVVEAVPNCYSVVVEAPAAGGFLAWGNKDERFFEDVIEPAPVDNGAQLVALADALQAAIDGQLASVRRELAALSEQTSANSATLQQVAEMDRAQRLMKELYTLLGGAVGIAPVNVRETTATDVAQERAKLAADRAKLAGALDEFLAEVESRGYGQ